MQHGPAAAGLPHWLMVRKVEGAGWRGLEDRVIAAKEAERPPEPPRPWWKGPKPRADVDIDEVWKINSEDAVGQAAVVGWGALLGVGLLSQGFRQIIEALDVFVGRYLLLTTVAYVGIKFVHFKIFDPFPF